MGLLEQCIEVVKECGLEVRSLANNRFSGWFKGQAIVQQLKTTGSGYVPGKLVQKVTGEFDSDLDNRNYVKFENYSTEKFKRLLEVATSAVLQDFLLIRHMRSWAVPNSSKASFFCSSLKYFHLR